jgi:hypothetical protein
MQNLNFPNYQFRLKNSENQTSIFDIIRKKFVVLTPEEWVRQHVVCYLNENLGFPLNHINVEKELKINGLKKRYDVVVFHPNGDIIILVECKSTAIEINQKTFDQIAQYNLKLKAKYLMVSNGLNHYFCQMDYENKRYDFLRELPQYKK